MIWKGRISDFTKYFSAPKALARSLSISPERAEMTTTGIFLVASSFFNFSKI